MSITLDEAIKKYNEYVSIGLGLFPPFKGYGQMLLRFALDEPDMYRMIFFEGYSANLDEYLDAKVDVEAVLQVIQSTFDLNPVDARWLLRNMLIYVHGMSAMIISGTVPIDERELAENLGGACRGFVMQLKSKPDERIRVMPGTETTDMGDFEEYIKGKKNVIIGYGDAGQMYQIKVETILYFEAVGDKVFAYTKTEVFEIKQRLYQVEEALGKFGFIRGAKSLLINLHKIMKIQPDAGSRGRITMINGETIIASRAYFGDIKEAMKEGRN